MATIYSRLKYYCYTHKKPELSADQKSVLGKLVLQRWFAQDLLKFPITKAPVHEPEGSFVVLSYCRKFNPQIDEIIHQFYESLPKPVAKKKRTRVPVRAYKSFKPLSQNGIN